MIPKDIFNISEKDLQSLIDNAVLEGKNIEYKKNLHTNTDKDKKEFLADVSSFANAGGGDLIIGISEDKGIPRILAGIEIEKLEEEIRRLDSIIRDGIEPRLPSFNIHHVSLSNSKTALIIRIAKSWTSPHRVIYKGHDKFYSRSSNGKYSLDVVELKAAFGLSQAIAERIRRFREERISKICINETPVSFEGNGKIILHLIPLISFNPGQKYNIEKIALESNRMPPIYSSGWSHRYNIDGVVTYTTNIKQISTAYTQLYRNGIIEAVEGFLIRPHIGTETKEFFIPSITYEKQLIESLYAYMKVLKSIEVELPIFVFLTLVDVKGYTMYIDRSFFLGKDPCIDRNILLLQETIIENYDTPPDKILKPCFDAIWNACGYPSSRNYDEKGNWKHGK